MSTQPTINNTQQWIQPVLDQATLMQALDSKKGDQLANQLINREYTNKPYQAPGNPYHMDASASTDTGQALTRGLNNYMSGLTFHQQQQDRNAYMQNQQAQASAFDLAMQQKRQQDLAEQAQKETELGSIFKGLSPELRGIYNNLDRTGQRTLLTDIASGRYGLGSIKGTGEGQQDIAKNSAVLSHVNQSYGNSAYTGMNPQASTAAQVHLGVKPTTALDIQQNYLQNQKAGNDLAAQPVQLEQGIQSKALDIKKAEVDLKYADALKQVDLLTAQGHLEDANRVRSHLDEGKALWGEAMTKWATMTPGEVQLFNSKMKSLELPYELPSKELKAVSEKGSVKEFYDPLTGKITKPVK